jgi:hypothetical protein
MANGTLSDVNFRISGPVSTLTGPQDSVSAINTTQLPDGAAVFELSQRTFYVLNKTSSAAQALPTVVAPSQGGPGRWFQFSSGTSIDPPLRNRYYVDPASTVLPQTGTVLAPFTTLDAAIVAFNAAPAGTQPTSIVLTPGSTFPTPPTITGDNYLDISPSEGLFPTLAFVAGFNWIGGDNASLNVSGVFFNGDITGVADTTTTGQAVFENCYLEAGRTAVFSTGAGGQVTNVYWSCDVIGNAFAVTPLSFIMGNLSTNGELVVSSTLTQSCTLSGANVYLRECNAIALALSMSSTACRVDQCTFSDTGIASVTFTGASGTFEIDAESSYKLDTFSPALAITNGTRRSFGLGFNRFRNLSSSGALSGNVAQAAIWSTPNPTPAGFYRVSGQIVKSAGGTSGNINLQLDQITDELGANTLVVAVTTVAGTGRNSFDFAGQGVIFWHNGSTQIRVGVAGIVTPGALQYFARIHIEKLN